MFGNSLLHAAKVLIGRDQPNTQTTSKERALLVRHLPGAKIIVEIGVYEGATTALLAEKCDTDALIYGIDPMFPGRLGICWGEVIASYVTRKARSSGRVTFVKRLSHEAADEVPPVVDFIFIDGDHSLAGIRRDWEVWAPRIRSGGIMALHDSFPALNSSPTLGSQQFYADVITQDRRFKLIGQEDSLAVLMRQ